MFNQGIHSHFYSHYYSHSYSYSHYRYYSYFYSLYLYSIQLGIQEWKTSILVSQNRIILWRQTTNRYKSKEPLPISKRLQEILSK